MIARMGVHVHLAVVADRVSDAVWHRIYEKARRVAKQWTPRPLATAWRQMGAVRVVQYALEIETTEGLHLVGDAETLTTGESFVFPATLVRRAKPQGLDSSPSAAHDDVLVAVASQLDPDAACTPALCNLLGAKTQGLPYHVLLVALGLLVENALPGTAMVYGDISLRDGEQARSCVASILGEELELPVVVDVARLRRRLAAAMDAGTVDEAVRRLSPPDPCRQAIFADLLGRWRSRPDARVRHELEHIVPSCRDPNHLAPGTRRLLCTILDAIHSNIVRWELRQRIEQWGTVRTREVLARATWERGVRLTSIAWDTIEAADLDEIAFVLGALCLDTTRWEVHHAVRGVLENRALRAAKPGCSADAEQSR